MPLTLIIQALTAIAPTLPKIKKLFSRPETGIKESLGGLVIAPIVYDIIATVEGCGVECVLPEQWGQLAGATVVLVIHLNCKCGKEAEAEAEEETE